MDHDILSIQVRVYLRYGSGWSQIRWRDSDYAVELYPCTESNLSATTHKFTNVPEDAEKRWKLQFNGGVYLNKFNLSDFYFCVFANNFPDFRLHCALQQCARLGV